MAIPTGVLIQVATSETLTLLPGGSRVRESEDLREGSVRDVRRADKWRGRFWNEAIVNGSFDKLPEALAER